MKKDDFIYYCLEFYGADGIYPIGATKETITKALDILSEVLIISQKEFCGDSIDRELIRDILSMRVDQALNIIQDVQISLQLPLLDTLMHIENNKCVHDSWTIKELIAFYVVTNDFRKALSYAYVTQNGYATA